MRVSEKKIEFINDHISFEALATELMIHLNSVWISFHKILIVNTQLSIGFVNLY